MTAHVPTRLRRAAALAALLGACATAASANPFSARDRRVVDRVEAGNASSEAMHGYAAHEDTTGTADGRAFRQARDWIRYALTTFDDTDVTIACTFLSTTSGDYDLVVEDSLIASRHYAAAGATPTVVEILVPYAVTKGKTSIAVVLRARGGPTPRLHELRTIQDHNEVAPFAVVQQHQTPMFSPPGVVR
ncbi:DUF6805 domain-containing protein [Gemmatimonas groenlandica]|uniref:Glycoside hydrolase GH146 substrate-binding domain-containing protein n=1 Tax=Gemmatimonas groenlandica TaxID=2732249 RepID=A0A6M4ILA9_9BACT|nr:DUF6805 domain-containing protein [Gemmatimonas groenlandica]QJR34669.1 hypothetical protein HKW67_03650 [Gemmatimonas groenlandica]